jgi:hypothetical protein
MMVMDDQQEQLEALYHLLVQARTGLEKIESDGDALTIYMLARNARIDLNAALRRLSYLLGYPNVYPVAEPDEQS